MKSVFCLLVLFTLAAESQVHAEVFKDGYLSFSYEPPLVWCTRGPKVALGLRTWAPEPSCSNLVCEEEDRSPDRDVPACVAYDWLCLLKPMPERVSVFVEDRLACESALSM